MMTAKKNRLGNGFSSLLEANTVSLSLTKLVGDSNGPLLTNNLFTLSPETSLDELAEDLGSPTLDRSMDLFIEQYTVPSYDSLDALLEANISGRAFTETLTLPSKDKKNLFDGLEDLLGG